MSWQQCSLLSGQAGTESFFHHLTQAIAFSKPSRAQGALLILLFHGGKSSKEVVINFFWLQFTSDSLSFTHCLASLKHYTLQTLTLVCTDAQPKAAASPGSLARGQGGRREKKKSWGNTPSTGIRGGPVALLMCG